jgi:hypothetical protein
MGLLSSIELPHWLMIGGAILIAMGVLSRLAFTRNNLRLTLIHLLYPAKDAAAAKAARYFKPQGKRMTRAEKRLTQPPA